MRILVIALNYAPEPIGIAPYVTGLCTRLADRGHTVRVLTTMPHYPEWRSSRLSRFDPGSAAPGAVRVRRLAHYVPSKPTLLRRVLSELSFGLRAVTTRWVRPDVVLLVSPALFSSVLAAVRSRVQRIPTVLWIQDVYTLGVAETRRRKFVAALAPVVRRSESAVVRHSDVVVVIHDRMRKVVEHLGASEQDIKVVRNWTHLPNRHFDDISATRRSLGWRPTELIVLHGGAMGHKQNLLNVVEAGRLAEHAGLPIRFVLMGDGSERDTVSKAAAGLSTVSVAPSLPQGVYQDALRAADILLVNEHPGLREMAVPSKLTSYFWAGRAIIAASHINSVTSEEVLHSGAGVRVDPGKPRELLDAVRSLMESAELRYSLGEMGTRYQLAHLSENVAVDAFSRVLAQLSPSLC